MAIEVIKPDKDVERYELNVGTAKRVVTLQVNSGIVKFNWGVYGPVQWPDAKEMLEGMLELSVLADQLTEELRHAEAAKKSRRR